MPASYGSDPSRGPLSFVSLIINLTIEIDSMSWEDGRSSVDVEAQKVIIQLALLGGLDILELLDPGAEVV